MVWKLRFSHVPTQPGRAEAPAGSTAALAVRDHRSTASRRPRDRRRRGHQRHPPHASRPQPLENAVKLVVPSATQVAGARHRRRDGPRPDGGLPRAGHGRRRRTAAMKAHLAAGHAVRRDRVGRRSASPTTSTRCARSARAWWARAPRTRCCGACPTAPPPRSPPATWTRRRSRRPCGCSARSRRSPPWRSPCRTTVTRRAAPTASCASPCGSRPWPSAGSSATSSTRPPPSRRRSPACARRPPAAAGPGRRRAGAGRRHRSGRALRRAPAGVDDAVLVNVGNGHTVCLLARDGGWPASSSTTPRCLDGPGLELRLRRWLAGDLAQRRGPRRPRPRRRAGARRRRRRPVRPAAHRHRAAPRAARRQRAAGRGRGAARRHDAHRLLRAAARPARADADPDEAARSRTTRDPARRAREAP